MSIAILFLAFVPGDSFVEASFTPTEDQDAYASLIRQSKDFGQPFIVFVDRPTIGMYRIYGRCKQRGWWKSGDIVLGNVVNGEVLGVSLGPVEDSRVIDVAEMHLAMLGWGLHIDPMPMRASPFAPAFAPCPTCRPSRR